MKPAKAVLALVVASALWLAGCTSTTSPSPGSPSPALSATPTPQPTGSTTEPAAGAVQKRATVNGVELVVSVDPLRVDGDLALLSVTVTDPDPALASSGSATLPPMSHLWRDAWLYVGAGVGAGLRVLDLPAHRVLMAAQDADGRPLAAVRGYLKDGQRYIVGVGVPTSDHVDVLLPSAGIVTGVPVLRDGNAGVVASTFAEFDVDLDPATTTARTYTLSEYRTSPSEDFRATRTGEDVEVSLSADVLFAYNKADLTTKADATLRRVGAQIVSAGTGELSIVGHTDDQGDTAGNQKLSERRAKAVAERLKTLVDLTGVEVKATGVGESAPAVNGTTSSARALNRRVELKYRAATSATATTTATALPTTAGRTGTAADGVTVMDKWSTPHTSWTVKVEQVTRKDGYLIGELSVTLQSGAASANRAAILGSGNFDAQGSYAPELGSSATRVSLLTADARTFPVQYTPEAAPSGQTPARWPLADTFLTTIVRGQPRTVTVIWPDVAGDDLTLDAAPPRWLIDYATKGRNVDSYLEYQPTFRITGIRVTG